MNDPVNHEPLSPASIAAQALRRLRLRRTRDIPVFRQLNSLECGATCLAMVLAYHGRHVRSEQLAKQLGVTRDGATANAIIDVARTHGLVTRAVRVDLDALPHLTSGAILHWDFNHFVVFERAWRDAVQIVDPAAGRRRLSLKQFSRSFTGVAVLCTPGEQFQPTVLEPKRLGRWLYSLVRGADFNRALTLSVILQLFALAAPLLTAAVVDNVVPHADLHLAKLLAIALGASVTFFFFSSLTRASLLLQLRTRIDAEMSMRFFEHLVSLPYEFFQRRASGDLFNRLATNTAVRQFLTSSVLSTVLDGGIALLSLVLLIALDLQLGACTLALGVLHGLIFVAVRARLSRLMAEDLRAQASCRGCEIDILQGIADLKTLGAEPNAIGLWSNFFVDTLNTALVRGRLMVFVDSLLASLRLGGPMAMLLIGTYFVLEGSLTLGSLLALNALATSFLISAGAVAGTLAQVQMLDAYLEQLSEVFSQRREVELANPTLPPPLTGAIGIEGIGFRFGSRSRDILKNVSLQIEPREFVAIVGPSGSGKSTLAHLLVGLYQPTEGRIVYDGMDLRSFDPRGLRRMLGIVLQKPHLFNTTVRGNIALATPDTSFEAIVDAAKAASIHDDIMAMPMQYDTILREDGSMLSGGQRQRLALARALVHKPAVVLLDEATSALDSVTETRVQASLESMRCTRILIAHRLSTVVRADRILVLEGGEIVEQGTHAELLAAAGAYHRLLQAQLREPC